MTTRFTLILHNIRSSENVGAMFRTADAAGVDKIYLTGYTPAPLDRFGRVNPKIAKTALGAEGWIPFESVKTLAPLINRLKKKGVVVVAVEQSKKSIPYTNWKAEFPVALIVGNEVTGIPASLIKKCDVALEIPMHGKKESLNVSVAAGIVLFKIAEIIGDGH